MRQLPTWDAVNAEYGKMTQMGWQSVQQAAKVGQMLIELKASCKHGEFTSKLTSVSGLKVDAANQMASRLMRLASNIKLLEKKKPESQADALRMIPTKKKKITPRPIVDDGDDEQYDDEHYKPSPEINRLGFVARADAAKEFALYVYPEDSPVDRSMVDSARAIAVLWNELALKLEQRL